MVVDLMHEIELGIWKTLLQHLIRILYSLGSDVVYEFNARFRQVSAFGRSTIRKFPYNVADLSGLAARDYEDILQCCIPCFDGLLPDPHNDTVLDLLYTLNYWHSMAKLRMHTDTSLHVFQQLTTVLGAALRYFADETCRHFQTFETDKEYQARSRASARRLAKVPGAAHPPDATGQPHISQTVPAIEVVVPPAELTPSIIPPALGKRPKKFNISTPKAHFFPDYVDQIKRFGTTDSLSTKLGESRHTRLKNYNNRTNFNNATPQIINIDVRDAVHLRMTHELEDLESSSTGEDTDSLATPDELIGAYRISSDERPRNRQFLPDLVKKNQGDPAFKKFIPRLKAHLLARKRGLPFTGNEAIFSDAELSTVIIRDHHIFSHATAGFNYTTYDVRRDQDTININSGRRDVLLPSFEPSFNANGQHTHPYWYARVLGIHHVNVFFNGQYISEKVHFLWVRWFGQDAEWKGGPSTLRLNRIGFVPSHDIDAFGFLDPALVIRASHLIPAFHCGRTPRLLGPSIAQDANEGDWVNYYVMRFADRDMIMRYLGMGVGHCQSPDFPREDGYVKHIPSGEHYSTEYTEGISGPWFYHNILTF
ncbi:hypothetical protein BD779DRAFT_1162769 [Infundibulicybe gibba]|nr:hypothetical protein BD779DRAFT_1162769 [Infundibulicybe gibba]